ncbi:branched-chain amino acid ABC transporter permease [Salinisphaera aquimarina]|uniref:Branched-chain amino acid ABC transporter permease n=1 Tax=Salinisphaera aquimarina TaxID=2094031 RepID=A0ABV7EMB8_9GAMM
MKRLLASPWLYAAAVVALMIALPFIVGQSGYYLTVFVMASLYVISAISLNLLTGYGGQVSVGHAGFLVVGAYTAAVLSTKLGLPFVIALPASGVMTALISLVIGLPAVRLRGHFLAVATLGFGLSVPQIALNWGSVTGGYSGMAVSRPDLLSSDLVFYYVVILFTVVITWMLYNIARSRMGRAFLAVRDSESAAAATGINVSFYKTIMFVVSAFFTGIAGGLYAYWTGFVSPNDFGISTSLLLLAMIVVGGLASITGAIIGAVVLTFIPHFTESYVGVTDLIIGAAVVLVILFRPAGIVSLGELVRGRGGRSDE